jgi:hypothetical protein
LSKPALEKKGNKKWEGSGIISTGKLRRVYPWAQM